MQNIRCDHLYTSPLQSVPDEVPFLAQRHPAWCHRLTLRARSTLCQKLTPKLYSAIDTGNRPVALAQRLGRCNRGLG